MSERLDTRHHWATWDKTCTQSAQPSVTIVKAIHLHGCCINTGPLQTYLLILDVEAAHINTQSRLDSIMDPWANQWSDAPTTGHFIHKLLWDPYGTRQYLWCPVGPCVKTTLSTTTIHKHNSSIYKYMTLKYITATIPSHVNNSRLHESMCWPLGHIGEMAGCRAVLMHSYPVRRPGAPRDFPYAMWTPW